MAEGQRDDAWNHTASLIVHVRQAMGDKDAKFEKYHPKHAGRFIAAQNRRLIAQMTAPKTDPTNQTNQTPVSKPEEP
jgi:hypothetical protein